MKILLVSDLESKYIWDYFDPENFKDIEFIISAGDLKAEYLSFIVTMINKPLFYIHGNHDTGYEIKRPEGCDCIEDKIVEYKNIRIMGLGGSKLYNSNSFQYTEKQMEMRALKMWPQILKYKGIDMLVTHAGGFKIGDDLDPCHEGFETFNTILDKYRPKYFIHGHTHLNYPNQNRIIKYKDTTVINAYEKYILEYQANPHS